MEAVVQYYKPVRVREHDRYILQTEIVEVPEPECVPVHEMPTCTYRQRSARDIFTDQRPIRSIASDQRAIRSIIEW